MKLWILNSIVAVVSVSLVTACSQTEPTPDVLATVESALATQAASFSATATANATMTSPTSTHTPPPIPTATTPRPMPTLSPQTQAQDILMSALTRYPAESIVNGLTVIDFSTLRKNIKNLDILNDASRNSYLSTAQSISLEFSHINVISATYEVIIFEGPLSQLDLHDVRHWLSDFGFQTGDYGGFELWRGSKITPQYGRLRNSGISAVAFGRDVIIAGKESEVKAAVKAMAGELATARHDPFAVWYYDNLAPGFGYHIRPFLEWPSGTSWIIYATDPTVVVRIHEQVRRPRSDETDQYSDQEILDARNEDGYQTRIVGDHFEGQRQDLAPLTAEFLR